MLFAVKKYLIKQCSEATWSRSQPFRIKLHAPTVSEETLVLYSVAFLYRGLLNHY